jgi:hypothetical protein
VKLSENAVYTTILPKTVFNASRGGQASGEMFENKRWVSALRQFQSAQKKGQAFPVLFSDARQCAALVYWAIIVDMKVSDVGTRYTFTQLKGLHDCFTQDLVLSSERRTIAPHFIRPYALVATPGFLETATVDAAQRLHEQDRWHMVDVDLGMAERMRAFTLDLKKDSEYMLDSEGDISCYSTPRHRGQPAEKALRLGIKRQEGFHYFLHDDDGQLGVYRAPVLGEGEADSSTASSLDTASPS